MADEVDKKIIIQYLVQSQDAIKNAEELRAKIDSVKTKLREAVEQNKGSLKDLAAGFKESGKAMIEAGKDPFKDLRGGLNRTITTVSSYKSIVNTAQKEVQNELKGTQKEVSSTESAFGSFGNTAKYIFGTVLGISAVQILRSIVDWLQRSAKAGYEFVKAMYQLEIGVRAIQRAGADTTIRDIYENIDRLRNKFKVFTTKELVEGTAALLNLTRDFGFTKEQIVELQDSIVTLALVNGRAMDEVQRTVALALSSGYTEGLQRLGVSINRVTIAEKAAALGYADSYMALNELQRAEATRLLILEKTQVYEEDLAEYYKTEPGRIDKSTTAWKEFTNTIGLRLVPFLAQAADWFFNLVEGLKGLTGILTLANSYVVAFQVTMRELPSIMRAWVTEGIPAIEEFSRRFQENLQKALEFSMPDIFGGDILGDTESANKAADRIKQVVSDSLEDLLDFEKDYDEKVEDLREDSKRDIEKIERESARRIEEEKIDHLAKLNQIEVDALRDIAEENAKYALDVAQTIRQFAIRKAEMESRYRENEKKAEIRFQEEMRRLREGFLFDLEDALHERDARQILRLIRQYNLQKTQAQRQYDIEKEERARAHKLELEELEVQRKERLRILAEEHAARIAAIQRQAEYEAELERQRWEREKAEMKARAEVQKSEREILLQQQIDDLNKERDRLLAEIGTTLWGSLQETTDTGLKTLYDSLVATLGEEGAKKVFSSYAVAAEQAAMDVEGSLSRVLGSMDAINRMKKELGLDKIGEEEEVEPLEIPVTPTIDEKDLGEKKQEIIDVLGEGLWDDVQTDTDEGIVALGTSLTNATAEEGPIETAFKTYNETALRWLGTALWDELNIETEDGLNDLLKALLKVLGPGGEAEKVLAYYRDAMRSAAQDAIAAIQTMVTALSAAYSISSMQFPTSNNLPTSGGSNNTGGGGGKSRKRQSGGPVYEGEVYAIHKDETFVPAVNGTILSKQQSQEALVNALGRGARSGMGEGRATIEVMLQPGLVAKIVDDALDQTANILISQMRKN